MDMAEEAEMGEIEEMHSKEDEEASDQLLNGDLSEVENGEEEEEEEEEEEDSQSSIKKGQTTDDTDSMDVDEEQQEQQQIDSPPDNNTNKSEKDDNTEPDDGETEKDDDDGDSVKSDSDSKTSDMMENGKSADEEVHEIIDDDEPIELNDSGDGDGDGDVMIIEEPKENGSMEEEKNELEVIELDTTPIKKHKDLTILTPRRSVRNLNKSKSYVESEKAQNSHSSEESDIEEVLPQDPLAMGNDKIEVKRSKHSNSSTIVVKDTKRLVEIAAKSNSNNSGNKKEPTLVIIDTNSILSGRGPVPVNNKSSSSSNQYPTLLPMALPAQGMYPPNMRATITPIPLNSSTASTTTPPPPPLTKAPSTCINPAALAPVLPTLTDDMFVVEAPSFIVPYVYEKPPVSDFKDFLKELRDKLTEDDDKETTKSDDEAAAPTTTKDDDLLDPLKKNYSYFDSPLGKFFIDIGFNLVQEFVQADMLRQQKKKRDREGGQNPATNKTIHSLMKNLEFTKESNEPFRTTMKKCEFCNFKTESQLVMAYHLETPHTKNYVYKCNFCTYEARSPHDILFHMEAEHAVRGRLERAPSFHQCPNCPFEDNQKGKLSRHLVACMRKFKPERNLDPPIDWEPPAKIPRVPKARQGINVSAYQAMKSSQLQFLSKMQLLNTNSSSTSQALHRGRGRPSLGSTSIKQSMIRPSGMVYKQTMSGGSVLVPTNYQVSGNQVYQVVGGQELGGRLGHPGMAFVPNIPSASSTVTIQNQSKNKSVHQPSISITPLPRASASPNSNLTSKPGDTNSKNSFVICEICDGYIKDLEQLRNHMQWIHKVKIHPKMIYNRPPLNCQKCQFRFFTDQGLERHLLGSHGLVTSSMQDAANKSKDAGRCPVCGRVYQWKLLNHVARDHSMTLKPAHLSYKCTVCTATFGMYKQFENHVYSAHSVVAKRVMDKKNSSSSKNDQMMKPLKINDEITIIPQPAKVAAKEGSPSSSTGSTNSRNSTPSTSKNADSTNASSDAKGAE
ncbi:MOG interacting and ectopic P-granules protein 1 isoform X2 [Tribolium castaneum]|uniref:MOG interacting and ectopic P-granules protein 1 isoform X2 n=1 Tax=Tribolium castaneum TaxID=7070 RepID=UPI00077DB0F9|nr:PREDICTED: MOG interacting and ectopic P-granules protein 1 isoform X2 [Tribolium castaneum]XP_015834288.1 PREDICTED: MOG interacting and ectopic P-granules protein 1 isoform X2 [Tribolium castaneum]|eukprot:XP_015834287.1 PREDICTED: MOG interacting and ectopic P-granules protein 1 isoform X2 [Tribolium castaneum]